MDTITSSEMVIFLRSISMGHYIDDKTRVLLNLGVNFGELGKFGHFLLFSALIRKLQIFCAMSKGNLL